MNPENIVASIRVLLLEILGFFLPGFVFLQVLFLYINFIKLSVPYYLQTNNFVNIFIASYIAGYILYGSVIIRDKLLIIISGKCKNIKYYKSKLFDDIMQSYIYKEVIIYINNNIIKIDCKKNSNELNTARNIAMSYSPESDTKIYLFMFRYDLCNHLSIISLLLIIVTSTGIVVSLFNRNISPFLEQLLLLIGVIFIHATFVLTRNRFGKIAYQIIFPIFLSKIKPLKESHYE